MAYIYKITNELNNKCYIGKTEKANPLERFHEHLKDRLKFPERPLYRAMNKYGIDYFSFEAIEETDNATEKEIYWIQHFNSYGSTGYNATLGGDGKKYLNHEKILSDYSEIKNMSEVARLNNCHYDSVKNILKANGIEIFDSSEVNKRNKNAVIMLDKNNQSEIMEFQNQMDAARYLKENGYSNITDLRKLSSKIGLVCRGQRKTSSGFGWKYKE